jgi:signal peptidase I
MTKKKPSAKASDVEESKAKPAEPRKDGVRETVESVVIAFVLAFLFRTFEAEAFVIPTGSMAPTLMGRHKDLACSECGFEYQVNASDEVDKTTNRQRYYARPDQNKRVSVMSSTCPVCRNTMDIAPENPQGETYPSYKGDRILVTKFSYQFKDPDRWDVVVFKYPGEATVNYIKRLVGLPNETVQIYHGNIRKRGPDDQEFHIERKTADKVEATLQVVHDNDVDEARALFSEQWRRWTPENGGWQTSDDGLSFATSGTGSDEGRWLRYHHIIPIYEEWLAASRGQAPSTAPPPQLVTDFTAYNTNRPEFKPYPVSPRLESNSRPEPETDVLGQHWVGDLALECDLTIENDKGTIALELVEGGQRFQCLFDVASGQAVLNIEGQEAFRPAGPSGVKGPGTYHVLFANVDEQLLVWVDGDLVQFDALTAYNGREPDAPRIDNQMPTRADLAPVGVASAGTEVKVTGLRVLRDIYYIASRNSHQLNDYERDIFAFLPAHVRDDFSQTASAKLRYLMSTPERWRELFSRRKPVDLPLGPDDFVVLGDNSPRSADSRLWYSNDPDYPRPYVVKRDLLIGKALFIYWPHSWMRTSRDGVWFPFFPNFARMGFVR